MAQADDSRIARLNQITIDAVVRAAGRGLLTPTEADLLINRLHTHLTTSSSSTQDSPQPQGGRS